MTNMRGAMNFGARAVQAARCHKRLSIPYGAFGKSNAIARAIARKSASNTSAGDVEAVGKRTILHVGVDDLVLTFFELVERTKSCCFGVLGCHGCVDLPPGFPNWRCAASRCRP